MGTTFWGVVSAAIEQSRCIANRVWSGRQEIRPLRRIPPNQKCLITDWSFSKLTNFNNIFHSGANKVMYVVIVAIYIPAMLFTQVMYEIRV